MLFLGLRNRGDRVIAAATPGMAAADTFQSQTAANERAMPSDSPQGVSRATRGEPALTEGPEQKGFCRRNHPTICPNAEN